MTSVHYEKVIAEIDEMQSEIVGLTSELVKRQSVNPKYPDSDAAKYLGGEKDCNLFLENHLASFGCTTDLFEKEKGRANLVATIKGRGGGRSLILSGHVDTVPFGNIERWDGKDPLSGKVTDGKIFGRGACDMKSGIASMIKAIEAVIRAGYKFQGNVILESVVGEETMDHLLGTTATVERGYRADAAIVTEPNSLHLSPVTTGVILMTVKIEGKATHATARDQMIRPGGGGDKVGVNAIEKAVKVIGLLRDLEEQWGITKQHPLFNPGHFVIHPGVIDGAPRGHRYVAVVPDYCTIDYAVLYNPSESPETVKQEIQDYLLAGSKLDTWLSLHPPVLDWKGVWPAGEISPNHDICKTISNMHEIASGSKIEIDGFPAPVDVPFLDQAGIPTTVFGPGDLPQAHSENEFVEIDQVIQSTKTLALTAMNWCGFSER
jgi:formylaminopyrimidine deformylase